MWQFFDAYGGLKTTDPAGRGVIYSDTAPSRTDVIWVDTSSAGDTSYVSALPGSPYDGQVIRFQNAAMATDGIVWTFRYNAASASAYKWEFIGGPPWTEEVDTSETTAAGPWQILTTPGPKLPVPLNGEYESEWGYTGANSTAGNVCYVTVGQAVALTTSTNSAQTTGTVMNTSVTKSKKVTLTAGGTDFSLYYGVSGGTGTFWARFISMTPIRVG